MKAFGIDIVLKINHLQGQMVHDTIDFFFWRELWLGVESDKQINITYLLAYAPVIFFVCVFLWNLVNTLLM